MRMVYRVLAGLIALEVMIQAAAMVYAVAGLGKWVDDGNQVSSNTFDAMFDGDVSFAGVGGFMLHGMNGMMIIPILALLLLISSFFAKVPGGILFAVLILADIALQIFLGLAGHELPAIGAIHGINALVLFGLAVSAMLKARHLDAGTAGPTTTPDTAAARV